MARIETVLLSNATSLIPRHAIVVYVASFKFLIFGNLEQLKACIDYYSHKTHSSSRIPAKDLAADLGGEGLERVAWLGYPALVRAAANVPYGRTKAQESSKGLKGSTGIGGEE